MQVNAVFAHPRGDFNSRAVQIGSAGVKHALSPSRMAKQETHLKRRSFQFGMAEFHQNKPNMANAPAVKIAATNAVKRRLAIMPPASHKPSRSPRFNRTTTPKIRDCGDRPECKKLDQRERFGDLRLGREGVSEIRAIRSVAAHMIQ